MIALPRWLAFLKKADGPAGFVAGWAVADLIDPVGNPSILMNVSILVIALGLMAIAFFVPIRT